MTKETILPLYQAARTHPLITISDAEGMLEEQKGSSICSSVCQVALTSLKLLGTNFGARIFYSELSGLGVENPSRLQRAVRLISMENIFSSEMKKSVNDWIVSPICIGRRKAVENLTPAFANPKVVEIVVASVSEQIIFQGVLQKILLQKIPKKALLQCAPEKADLVDHKAVCIARVLFTAALFALCHTNQWAAEKGGTVPQFAAGLLYATAVEKGGVKDFLSTIVAHTALNLLFYVGGQS